MISGSPESLLEHARIAKKENRLEEAAELFRKALTACVPSDSPALCATLYEELAYVERNLQDLNASLKLYRQASRVYRDLGNPLKVAHTMRHAADILREQKRQDEATPLYAETLEIYRKHKDTPPLDLANAIRGFALLKEDVGDRTEALSLWGEARDLYQLTGIEAGVLESSRRIGLLVGN
jgi:tetratricopeptide (TPR) repeat protein